MKFKIIKEKEKKEHLSNKKGHKEKKKAKQKIKIKKKRKKKRKKELLSIEKHKKLKNVIYIKKNK